MQFRHVKRFTKEVSAILFSLSWCFDDVDPVLDLKRKVQQVEEWGVASVAGAQGGGGRENGKRETLTETELPLPQLLFRTPVIQEQDWEQPLYLVWERAEVNVLLWSDEVSPVLGTIHWIELQSFYSCGKVWTSHNVVYWYVVVTFSYICYIRFLIPKPLPTRQWGVSATPSRGHLRWKLEKTPGIRLLRLCCVAALFSKRYDDDYRLRRCSSRFRTSRRKRLIAGEGSRIVDHGPRHKLHLKKKKKNCNNMTITLKALKVLIKSWSTRGK